MNDIQYRVYLKAYFCRQFELFVADLIKQKKIYIPTYLSIGQEMIPAVFSELYPNAVIFPQHRCHSWFLCYGGKSEILLKQLLGVVDEESNGMQGSASLSIPGKMYGHDGLLGSQIPIAVGYADSSSKHTICVAGDAAVEEDYALGAFGYSATKNVPITFIVEDNDLSILTKKEIRRSWDIVDVANAMDIYSDSIDDSYISLARERILKDKPCLLNIRTERHYWHAGPGQDQKPQTDRLLELETLCNEETIQKAKENWEHSRIQLEKLLARI